MGNGQLHGVKSPPLPTSPAPPPSCDEPVPSSPTDVTTSSPPPTLTPPDPTPDPDPPPAHLGAPANVLPLSAPPSSDSAGPITSPATPRRTKFGATLPPIALRSSSPVPASPGSPSPTPSSPSVKTPSPTSPSWQLDSNEHRSLICRFCGGPSCKHEDWTRQRDYPTSAAIRGLHSSFILPSLIGMQRPSSRLIALHSVQQQFEALNVTALINLQVAGEHALCGDGIHPHGFSYHPEELLPTHHYAFGWQDMSIPTLERMCNIVQVVEAHTRRGGKVAVHCHAGYGRTGLVVACFLIYSHHYSADLAISTVRGKREGSVQTKEQKRFVYRFEQFLTFIRCHYPSLHHTTPVSHSLQLASPARPSPLLQPASPGSATTPVSIPPLSPTPALPASLSFTVGPVTLPTLLSHQRHFLHGPERAHFRFSSKLVHLLTAYLSSQAAALCADLAARAEATPHSVPTPGPPFLLHFPFDWAATFTLEDASALHRLKSAANLDDCSHVSSSPPFVVLLALLHFLSGLAAPLLPWGGPAGLPSTLGDGFPSIARSVLPSLHEVVACVHALHFAALPHSSDALPLSSFVLLTFGFALLHPKAPVPPALELCLQRRVEVSGERVRVDGDPGKDEEAGGLNALLCFMSVLIAEWHGEFNAWHQRDAADRQLRRVGVGSGDRWWINTPTVSRTPASSDSGEGLGRGSTPGSTSGSGVEAGVGGESPSLGKAGEGMGGTMPAGLFVLDPAVAGGTGGLAEVPVVPSPMSARGGMRPLKGLTPRMQGGGGVEGQNGEERREKGSVEGVKMDEQKEGGVAVVAEPVMAVVLPPVSIGRRGSGTRPMLPPIRVTRPGSAASAASQ